ncbi:MAG: glycosyltransferase [Flavobacteriaceae bacterium]|nr:glycosyltransferase [Flavobacteriaceae bacterium]
MSKKSLIFILPAFPSPDESDSFMVPFIQQFIVGFKDNYPNTTLIIYTLYSPESNPYLWRNIQVIPLNFKKGKSFLKLFYLTNSILKISKKIKKNNVVGILSFWHTETAMIGNIVGFLKSIKQYTWLQGQDVKRSNKYMLFFPPNPNKLIALSNFQNEYLYKEFGFYASKVNTISVNSSFFPELNTSSRTIDIIGIGSFIPLKNFQLFLNVILKLKKKNPKIRVVIVGNGPLESKLKTFCISNKLEKNVTFTGLISHKQSLDYINNSKILLHTSNFEGGGAVVHEALYLGCQVIGRIPIIEQRNASFYCCNSLDEITHKATELLQNPKPIKSFVAYDMKQSTKTIYNLFSEF